MLDDGQTINKDSVHVAKLQVDTVAKTETKATVRVTTAHSHYNNSHYPSKLLAQQLGPQAATSTQPGQQATTMLLGVPTTRSSEGGT